MSPRHQSFSLKVALIFRICPPQTMSKRPLDDDAPDKGGGPRGRLGGSNFQQRRRSYAPTQPALHQGSGPSTNRRSLTPPVSPVRACTRRTCLLRISVPDMRLVVQPRRHSHGRAFIHASTLSYPPVRLRSTLIRMRHRHCMLEMVAQRSVRCHLHGAATRGHLRPLLPPQLAGLVAHVMVDRLQA